MAKEAGSSRTPVDVFSLLDKPLPDRKRKGVMASKTVDPPVAKKHQGSGKEALKPPPPKNVKASGVVQEIIQVDKKKTEGRSTVALSSLWNTGKMSDDLIREIHPPKRMFDSTELTEDEMDLLSDMAKTTIKTAAMLQAFASVHRKYGNAKAESQGLKEELTNARKKLEEAEQATSAALKAEEETRKKAARDQQRAQEAEELVKALRLEKDKLVEEAKEKDKVNAELEEEAEAMHTSLGTYKLALAEAVDVSFINAIRQIEITHPGIFLDASKLHSRAKVVDGQIIQPPQPAASPDAVSVTRITKDPREEAGDEASTLVK